MIAHISGHVKEKKKTNNWNNSVVASATVTTGASAGTRARVPLSIAAVRGTVLLPLVVVVSIAVCIVVLAAVVIV